MTGKIALSLLKGNVHGATRLLHESLITADTNIHSYSPSRVIEMNIKTGTRQIFSCWVIIFIGLTYGKTPWSLCQNRRSGSVGKLSKGHFHKRSSALSAELTLTWISDLAGSWPSRKVCFLFCLQDLCEYLWQCEDTLMTEAFIFFPWHKSMFTVHRKCRWMF